MCRRGAVTFAGVATPAFRGRGRHHPIANLGELSHQVLQALHFAFVGHLLLLGVLDEFQDFLHVLESLLQRVDDPFHLQHRLLDGAGRGGAVGQRLDRSWQWSRRQRLDRLSGTILGRGALVLAFVLTILIAILIAIVVAFPLPLLLPLLVLAPVPITLPPPFPTPIGFATSQSVVRLAGGTDLGTGLAADFFGFGMRTGRLLEIAVPGSFRPDFHLVGHVHGPTGTRVLNAGLDGVRGDFGRGGFRAGHRFGRRLGG